MSGQIRRRFFYAFGTLIALIIIVGSISYFTMTKTVNEYSELIDHEVEQIQLLDQLLVLQGQIATDIRGFIIFKDERFLQLVNDREEERTQLLEQIHQLTKEMEADQSLAKIEDLQQQVIAYEALTVDMLDVAENGTINDIQQVGQEMNSRYEGIMESTETIKQLATDELHQTNDALHHANQNAIVWIALLIVGATVAGLFIAYFIGRSVTQPIQSLTHHMKEMANGNLRLEQLPVKGTDELAQMSDSFNLMLKKFQQLIRQMTDSSTLLAAQSEELSASSEQSLASSEHVAKSAETTMENSETQSRYIAQSTQSIREVSHGIEEISRSNEDMLQSAAHMSEAVDEGMNVIQDVSKRMEEINETIRQSTCMMEEMAQKSNEIQEVSALITNISEQTNLLALNAAIEAARAGEHGAGFAVVANEVRQLAEESHVSAAKIEEMIADVYEASQNAVTSIVTGHEKASAGLKRTEDSVAIFNQIESSVRDVNAVIETIAAAIEEIQAMSESVMNNSQSLQELAVQSAASAENTGAATEEQLAAMQEISASSESLSRVAEELQQEIQQFRL